jgi:NTE family protein
MEPDLRIGLALGGGGAAALSYIGVIGRLEEAGLRFSCISGTSAGAIVGSAHAAGHLAELREAMTALRRSRFYSLFDFCWNGDGLMHGRRGMDLVAPAIGGNIEDLPLPFAAVATDLDTGETVVLDHGSVWDAVRASLAIPGVFRPHSIDGRVLVDGALSNPIPVDVARRMGADFVIGVSVLPLRRRTTPPSADFASAADNADAAAEACETAASLGMLDVIAKGSAVIQCHIADARLRDDPPDELLLPDTRDIGVFSLLRSAEAIEAGRECAEEALPRLLESIEARRRELASPLRRFLPRSLLPQSFARSRAI